MSTNFPGALDALTNPLGSDSQAVVSHAAQHANANDAIEAIEITIGTDATPKLARLLGVMGGQTLIGGTAATDVLTLQGTSGDGTATAKAVRVAVGNSGSTEAVTVRNDGNVGVGNMDPSADFTVGANVFRVDGSLLAIGSGASLGSVTIGISASPFIGQVNSKFTITDPTIRQAGATTITRFEPTASPLTTVGRSHDIVVPATNTYDLTASNYGEYVNFEVAGSGTAVNSVASYVKGLWKSSALCTFFGGSIGVLHHLSAAAITKANPLNGVLVNGGGGTIGTGWGTEGNISNQSGTITNAVAVGAGMTNSAGATITNLYLLSAGGPAETFTNAGTITNCYALYIGSNTNTGTNKWSIYNESPAVSYLAGSLALGVTAASAKVHAISTTEQLRRGYDASNYLSSTTASDGKTTFTAVGTAPGLKWLMSDATTNAIYDLVTFSKNTSSAGAAGLGVRVNLAAKSSTTGDTLVGAIDASWVDATHASRKGRVKISAYDTAIRECIRAEASGTAAMLGFFGVAAVVRPTALTAQLTTLTYTAPGTPDYAIQNLTSTGGFGFVTADEGNTVLSVIKNLQDRVAQLESKLQSLGLLT